MIEMKDLMKQSLIDKALEEGGRIEPLIIPSEKTGGLGLCNPSIFKLEAKDKYLVNVRNVSYYLHHCEGEQKYQTPWGPLNYVRPDNDPYLRTDNYLCEFSLRNQVLSNPRKVDTSEIPSEPEWDFVGLEDARIVKWDDKMYLTGVIRHAPDGKGRMVLSEIVITKKTVKEVNRFTIEPPEGPDVYCEKNWMPILDRPFHYVKWSNPLQVVKVDINKCTSSTVYQSKDTLDLQLDPRGGSQVIPWKDGTYLAVTHECDYWQNVKGDRDSHYYHRFMQWDTDWNLINHSKPFKFMDGRIEFCCGMAKHPNCDDVYVTFGFQDNSAYLAQIPLGVIEDIWL
tara:strand:+ start:711 stop:1727 length:1017 start_codon:yes stop_codon:yes gene_type:complete